jgi:serine phosphatase RsbU (regulator of sigma subunit)
LFKHQGEGYKLTSLLSKGSRLGESPEIPQIGEQSVEIGSHDILFLYTDGLLENKKINTEEQFGKKNAKNAVEKSLQYGLDQGMSEVVKEVQEFGKGKPFDDDITLAFLQLKDSI